MEKYDTVLKAFVGIIIGLTFLLACIALGKENHNERSLTDVIGNVDQMETSQKDLEVKVRETERNTSISLAGIKSQLTGLAVNKYCQNNWKYFDGKCYYFSSPAHTLTWTEAQKQCKVLNKKSMLAMPKTTGENFLGRSQQEPQ